MTFGKVMGGGFPAAAFGGGAELMAHLAPVGDVYQAGTLSGNPVASAAGLTTLRLATDEVYEQLDKTSAALRGEVAAALSAAGVPHVVSERREHVQRLLRAIRCGRRPELRRRLDAVDEGVRGVLPQHARRGNLPAAERVRGMVPVRDA